MKTRTGAPRYSSKISKPDQSKYREKGVFLGSGGLFIKEKYLNFVYEISYRGRNSDF